MPLAKQLWRELNHSIITWQILGSYARGRNCLSFAAAWDLHRVIGVVKVANILMFFALCFSFDSMWRVWPMLPMSLNCTLSIVHSVFSNVYVSSQSMLHKRWLLFRAEYSMLLKTGNNWYHLERQTTHFFIDFYLIFYLWTSTYILASEYMITMTNTMTYKYNILNCSKINTAIT